jgi:hypothetical protein
MVIAENAHIRLTYENPFYVVYRDDVNLQRVFSNSPDAWDYYVKWEQRPPRYHQPFLWVDGIIG